MTEEMAIKKVLIVDDSPTERHVLNEMLTKAGFEVIVSDNGETRSSRRSANGRT
jgi:twitching motility two-component system response regulator PilH